MYFKFYSKISTTINMTENMSPRKLGSIIDTVKTPDIIIEVDEHKVLLDDLIINKLKKFRNIGLFHIGGSDKSINFLKKFAKKIQKPLHVVVVLEKSIHLEKFVDVDNLVSLNVYLSEWEDSFKVFPAFKDLKNLEIKTPCPPRFEKFKYNSIVDLALVQKKLRTLVIRPREDAEVDKDYFLQLKRGLPNLKKFYMAGSICWQGAGFRFLVDNENSRKLNMLFDPSVKSPADFIIDDKEYFAKVNDLSDKILSFTSGEFSVFRSIENIQKLNNFKNYTTLYLEVPVTEDSLRSISSLKYIKHLYLTGDTLLEHIEIKGPGLLKSLALTANNKSGINIETKNLKSLEKLTLSGEHIIKKVSLPEKLKKLGIYADDIKADAFSHSGFNNIENLDARLTDKNSSAVFSLLTLKNVRTVELDCGQNSHLNLKSISGSIDFLSLSNCKIDQDSINTIMKSNIKTLSFYYCTFLKETFSIQFANRALEELTFKHPRGANSDGHRIKFNNLKYYGKLRFLRLHNFYTEPQSLKNLSEAPALELLELNDVNLENNEKTTIDLNSSKTLRYIINYDDSIKFTPLRMK
ncbi:hypothetical protein KKF97_11970 [Myxococcota bacterium]|nr:hypothetical protein [Myxococcota bacterium]MBU1379814.1 hypothetical protein [Myxococcota bacterium]